MSQSKTFDVGCCLTFYPHYTTRTTQICFHIFGTIFSCEWILFIEKLLLLLSVQRDTVSLLLCVIGTEQWQCYRKQQFEYQLLMNTWKVKWEDIEPLRSGKPTKDGSTVYASCLQQY